MKKAEISRELQRRHQRFIGSLREMSDADFVQHLPAKWTPGQHLEHMFRSVKALSRARLVPRFALPLLFGKSNRNSRSYVGLVDRYEQKLAEGGQATGKFIPPPVQLEQKADLLQGLGREAGKVAKWTESFSEEQLDRLVLPHPLLGKVTIREMLFFTLHHVDHHREIIFRDLDQVKNHSL